MKGMIVFLCNSFNGLKRFNYTRASLRFYCETLNRFVIAKASLAIINYARTTFRDDANYREINK